jgi:hypothetical protein
MFRLSKFSVLFLTGLSLSSFCFADTLTISPNPVHVPAGGAATVTVTWGADNHLFPWNSFAYACLYVGIDSNEATGPLDCEHPGHTYHVTLNWITYPHTYKFMLVPDNATSHVPGLYPPTYSNGSLGGWDFTSLTAVSP